MESDASMARLKRRADPSGKMGFFLDVHCNGLVFFFLI